VDGAVARLTLERPEAMNALDRDLTTAIERALEDLAAAGAPTVLVLAGQGRAFCAGNDIAEMGAITGDEAQALAERQARLMARFAALPQVTIAAIHGHALGGGLMLALAQDLRVAEASARLGLPEVTLGFNPGYGIERLLDVAGGAHARDLMLTARIVGAEEAHRMGLVTRVVPDGTLGEAVEALTRDIARHPPEGLAASKAIVADIRAGRGGSEPRAYGAALRASGIARARIAAFLARKRRRP
jgi:enoyl-CoA hydratase